MGTAAIVAAGLVAVRPVLAAGPESTDPIKIAWMAYTGGQVSAKVVGTILERLGYKVEYVPTTDQAQWQALADEDINLQAEQWLVSQKVPYDKAVAAGQISELGDVGIVGYEGWFYPKYIEAKCPGLPSWEALKKCGELFATPETMPNGRVVDYPEDWTPDSPKWIDALGLPLQAVSAGGEGALVAEVRAAFARQEPLLIMLWSPHFVFFDHEMVFVEFPKWDPACESDPGWGINPDKPFDCGAPIPPIRKFGSPEFPKKWPGAAEVAKRFHLTNPQQEELMKVIEVDQAEIDKAVNDWLAANEAVWKPWIEGVQ
jgi:glycine betaine/proline transport system substrate-binding protein